MVGLAQHVEQDGIDVVRRLVSGPVSGTLDHAEVERALEGGKEASSVLEIGAHEGVATAPDSRDARADGGQRALERVGGGNAPRPKASAAEIVHLEEEGEIVDAIRPRDHQAMEILAMRAVRFLGARVGLDAEE